MAIVAYYTSAPAPPASPPTTSSMMVKRMTVKPGTFTVVKRAATVERAATATTATAVAKTPDRKWWIIGGVGVLGLAFLAYRLAR